MSVRTFLFIQGLASPFMHTLARRLRAEGHKALRVNLSGADLAVWPERACNYRGRAAQWPAFIAGFLRKQQVTDLIVFGDCRPYHMAAIDAARRLGLATHVFEEGYIRPDWITLEETGTNGYSGIPHDPDSIRTVARGFAEPAPPVPIPGSLFNRAVWDIAANVIGAILWPMFPHYRWHGTDHPFLEYLGWLKRFATSPARRMRTQHVIKTVVEAGLPYYLMPLQLHSDYQIRVHSPYAHPIEAAEEIIVSFARHAPAETQIVFKLHPLDNHLFDYRGALNGIAAREGIAGRLHIIDDGDLATLLKRSRGVVLVNSSIATPALEFGCAVKALGTATYDMPGLTFQGPLDDFWSARMQPDAELYRAYRRVVIALTQVNGGFFTGVAIETGTRLAKDRILAAGLRAPSLVPSPRNRMTPRRAPLPAAARVHRPIVPGE
jgi:capsular polysaccharide export protein